MDPKERKDSRIQELTVFNEIKNDHKKIKKPPRLRKQKKRLSRKEFRDLGLFSLPRKTLKYEDYTQLNGLWNSYMEQQFGAGDKTLQEKFESTHSQYDQISALLHKGDFHGAKVKVSHSKCASLVGQKGIILMDTKNTFSIICKDNVLRILPKGDSVFELKWKSVRFTILGKHLSHRSADRSTKKMKSIALVEL